jgi:hypothetical protein
MASTIAGQRKMIRLSGAPLIGLLVLWCSFSFRPQAGIEVQFVHQVGDKPLELDSVHYRNGLGQGYVVSKFRYYAGDFRWEKADGTSVSTGSTYYLIDEENPDSKRIAFGQIPPGRYKSVSFLIGVDSIHNCSGLQSGALDPTNGMFWTWNTGYIFLKLEGTAPASTSPGHFFEYHIGGFREPNNCIRTVRLTFAQELTVGPDSHPKVRIKTDVAEILTRPVDIDFSKLSSVTDYHHAVMMANNYADMFQILDVQP